MKKQDFTRRAFLASATTTAVAAAGCCTKTNKAQVIPKKLSPNERVNVASIGAGGQANSDIMGAYKNGANIVALCDVDWKNSEQMFAKFGDAKKFKNFRKMLDDMGKGIDGVIITTPDHFHAIAAYECMKRGLHVRVQKPLTHTIAEARLLRDVARETKVTTQMGNQGHSGDGVRQMCEMLWDGAIGDLKAVHIWTNRPIWPQGIAEPLPAQPVPDTMDWDTWIGPAPMRPFNPGYAPFKWRGWWDFGCGAVGDMSCHIVDPAFWALKLGDAASFTCEVVMQEGLTKECPPTKSILKYTFPARSGMPPCEFFWYDGKGNLPPRPEGVPAGEKLGDGDNGSYFVGTKGVLTTGCYGDESRIVPAEKMKDYKMPAPTLPRVPKEDHTGDWIAAIKEGRKEASSHFEYAVPLTIVANMGNVAMRAGTKIEYDVKAGKITNNKDANKFLTKEYRKGWELPC